MSRHRLSDPMLDSIEYMLLRDRHPDLIATIAGKLEEGLTPDEVMSILPKNTMGDVIRGAIRHMTRMMQERVANPGIPPAVLETLRAGLNAYEMEGQDGTPEFATELDQARAWLTAQEEAQGDK